MNLTFTQRKDKAVLINVADLVDPNDKQGRSYRKINKATAHKLKVGDRVQVMGDMVLYITKLIRDCDETPLYAVGNRNAKTYEHGFSEEVIVKLPDVPQHKQREKNDE